MTTNRREARICIVLLVLLAGRAWSQQTAQPVEQAVLKAPEPWGSRFADIEGLLREQKNQEAHTRALALVSDMGNALEDTPSSAPLLARAVFLRALTSALQGQREDAYWDWTVARTFDPEIAKIDLSRFGEAGRLLEEARKPAKPAGSESKPEKPDPKKVQAPRKKHAPPPAYPQSLRAACKRAAVMVEAIVDENGIPTIGRSLTPGSPVLALAALEALRDWTFEPAMYQGKPIRIYYTLTVGFEKPNCNK